MCIWHGRWSIRNILELLKKQYHYIPDTVLNQSVKIIPDMIWISEFFWNGTYCFLRIDVGQLKGLLKCVFKRLADNWRFWKCWNRIGLTRMFNDVENLAFGCIAGTPRSSSITSIDVFVIEGIEGLQAYNPFKAILQPKPAENFSHMCLIGIWEYLLHKTQKKKLIRTKKAWFVVDYLLVFN